MARVSATVLRTSWFKRTREFSQAHLGIKIFSMKSLHNLCFSCMLYSNLGTVWIFFGSIWELKLFHAKFSWKFRFPNEALQDESKLRSSTSRPCGKLIGQHSVHSATHRRGRTGRRESRRCTKIEVGVPACTCTTATATPLSPPDSPALPLKSEWMTSWLLIAIQCRCAFWQLPHDCFSLLHQPFTGSNKVARFHSVRLVKLMS